MRAVRFEDRHPQGLAIFEREVAIFERNGLSLVDRPGRRSAVRRRGDARPAEHDVMIRRRVGLGEVAAVVDAARLAARRRGGDHQPGDHEHVLQRPAGGVVELQGEDVAAPAVDPVGGLGQAGGVAGDPEPSPEQGAERFADVADVDAGVAVARLRGGDRRDLERARALAIELGDDVLGRAGAEDQALEQAVRGQPIGAVQARAGHLAGRPRGRAAWSGR